ncbi:unnamed protein product [Clonostachys rosea f. rosea IK726]|uniref:Nucleolar protein 12 n=2 Tax=Bionectria ochroleuca TaxID=29856 RepID=A0A0B7JW80_BIOOC|nr:unnamed protein product [Clonostachys rosea f. rosea IK726]
MAKKNKEVSLTASSSAVDPTLDALFSASSGPVKAPPKSRYSSLSEKKAEDSAQKQAQDDGSDDEAESPSEGDEDEVLSEASQELDYDDEGGDEEQDDEDEDDDEGAPLEKEHGSDELKEVASEDVEMTVASPETAKPKRERKRKRKDDNGELEDRYLSKLADDATEAPVGKRQKAESATGDDNEDGDDEVPQHESLSKDEKSSELEKADRTVFLANVSSEAVGSKAAKKTLINHLSSVLEGDDKVESIRFRSVAFSVGAMPKRAAYITKQLMNATTKSANAYAVYSSAAGARKAVNTLNGTEVLGRHIRVDSVAHPSPTDHRRCVFVGNLGFVDDESILQKTEEGETVQKKRNKTPADVEEGLWRTFGTQGKVENVRVVRDPKTRVGKGFAYVQFYDGNAVESALLLDGKKFPPMLPRALRVTRAKDPRKTAQAQKRLAESGKGVNGDSKNTKYRKKLTPEELSMGGRAAKLLGRSGAAAERRKARVTDNKDNDVPSTVLKTPEEIVFEGTRASVRTGAAKGKRLSKKLRGKKGSQPTGRGARRAAEWKKKQRETAA